MVAIGLKDATTLAISALDVGAYGEASETIKAANRAVSNAVDFSVSTGVLMVFVVVMVVIIMLLLAERRTERRAMANREAARDKAADERYKIDAAQQERDITSRDNLAEALRELSVLIRTRICNTDTSSSNTPTRLLPKPEKGPF